MAGADEARASHFNGLGFRSLFSSPRKGLSRRVGLVPEDRRKQGLFVDQSVGFNISIAKLSNATTGGVLAGPKEKELAQRYMSRLRIKTPNKDEIVGNLSGGNQQKAALARWLLRDSSVMILDEPTRGVDIGAKREIYELIDALARAGKAILVISSDLPEAIGIADRVLVVRGGKVVKELSADEASEETVMRHAVGASTDHQTARAGDQP